MNLYFLLEILLVVHLVALNCLVFLEGVLMLLFVSRNLLIDQGKGFRGFRSLLLLACFYHLSFVLLVCPVFIFAICCIFLIFCANVNFCSLFVIIRKFLDDRQDPLNHKTKARLFFLKLPELSLHIQKVEMHKPQNIFDLCKGGQVAFHLF